MSDKPKTIELTPFEVFCLMASSLSLYCDLEASVSDDSDEEFERSQTDLGKAIVMAYCKLAEFSLEDIFPLDNPSRLDMIDSYQEMISYIEDEMLEPEDTEELDSTINTQKYLH